ncbi:TauD/TfdA family dioxygenase [Streptomyces seoulensis]
MSTRAASVVPVRVSSADQARELVHRQGAAILTGVPDEPTALSMGQRVMGDRAVRITTQIDVTGQSEAAQAEAVSAQPADASGRKRSFSISQELMPPHNDGYAFGDFAPDHLFLWCERPAVTGGESFLIDTSAMISLLEADPLRADLAAFCRAVDIDHSEPNYPQDGYAPIVRVTPTGRFQGRYHPYLSPANGPQEQDAWTFIRQWEEAALGARDNGPTFRLEAGEMLCIDNYRMLHGRAGHNDPLRSLRSIWGWSTEAVAIPSGQLDIVDPQIEHVIESS